MQTLEESQKLWIDALRSGIYKQGHCLLRMHDLFCCLGVACEIYQKEMRDLVVLKDEDGVYSYDNSSKYLPVKVKEWLGLKNVEYEIADLNDRRIPFHIIANFIEENQSDLFIKE